MDDEEFLRKRVKWQYKPLKKPNAKNLGDTAENLLKNKISPTFEKLGPVLEIWEQMLPPDFLEHCRIIQITGRTLEVAVDWPSYAHELRLCSEEMVSHIQQQCRRSGIDKIKIVLGN